MSKVITDIEGEDLPDLRKQDIRLRISKVVGINTRPDTEFSKRELNMIYAYLTGDHYFPKWEYNTSKSPHDGVLRLALAEAGDATGFVLWAEDLHEGAFPVRPFRKAELADLCETVETTSDQRPRPE